MMERVDTLSDSRSGRPKKTATALRPFVALDPNINPWDIPRLYQGSIPVVYGTLPLLVRKLTQSLSPGDKYLAIQKRYVHRFPDGRAFKIFLRVKQDNIVPVGGKVWIRDSRGRRSVINDVKSLFGVHWPAARALYKDNDLASIMERTRTSLAGVGLRPAAGDWYRTTDLASYLWRRMDVDLKSVPCLTVRHGGPGNLQGYNVFGHTDEPVYFYDIHSAYLSVMTEFEALKPFALKIWNARQELREANDPSEHIVKLLGTVMPGKFASKLPNNRYYRPILYNYICQNINDRLETAMSHVNGYWNRQRWCVDGFISNQDVSDKLDIGEGLGQWKPVEKHEWLTIAHTNVWWTNGAHKDNGYPVTQQQVLDNPEEIHTYRTLFDWDTLTERQEPHVIEQNHYEDHCRACKGEGGNLHDTLPRGILL